jgi:hypothetical protein
MKSSFDFQKMIEIKIFDFFRFESLKLKILFSWLFSWKSINILMSTDKTKRNAKMYEREVIWNQVLTFRKWLKSKYFIFFVSNLWNWNFFFLDYSLEQSRNILMSTDKTKRNAKMYEREVVWNHVLSVRKWLKSKYLISFCFESLKLKFLFSWLFSWTKHKYFDVHR